jgi:hypothetical protein
MLTTNRDCQRDGAKNAIPTMGEIEGRMAVLEVVAQSALTHALDEGDDLVDANLLAEIRKAMRDKCSELKLDKADSVAAICFAEELIEAAIEASHLVKQ